MRKTNTILFVAFILLSWTGLQGQFQYLSPYDGNGVPLNLAPQDTIPSQVLSNIGASLPEGFPVPIYNPQYIATGSETDIRLQDSAEVWVTFVAEGAGYRNVLGFYTYDMNNPPGQRPPDSAITIIFPNTSFYNSGGALRSGYKVYLGTYPANTGIGWVLVADGWNGRGVGSGNWTLFSNPDFNPESNPNLRYHNVLLRDTVYDLVVMGFEDIRRDNGGCDNDFNDALFYITANPFTAIITDSMEVVTEGDTNTSGGNNGGLESNGSLAQCIAQRNLERLGQDAHRFDNPASMQPFDRSMNKDRIPHAITLHGTEAVTLEALLPEDAIPGATAYVSTPSYLLGITNAVEIMSLDYFTGQNRVAALLAITTENRPYNHTKYICDRLGGSAIESIEQVYIRNQPFMITKIRKPDGSVEYAAAVSIQEEENGLLAAESHWNLGHYPEITGNYYNFQVWGLSPAMAHRLIEQVLEKADIQGPLSNIRVSDPPQVYIRSGSYQQGQVKLELVNSAGVSSLEAKISKTATETEAREESKENFRISTDPQSTLTLETGNLFDLELGLRLEGQGLIDQVYFADGPWTTDYVRSETELSEFKVLPQESMLTTDAYQLERTATASGSYSGYVSLVKALDPVFRSKDVRQWSNLEFDAKGVGTLEIKLMEAGGQGWSMRIELTGEETHYNLPLDEFHDANGNTFQGSWLNALYFSQVGSEQVSTNFEILVGEVSFTKNKEAGNNVSNALYSVFPNPANNQYNVQLRATENGEATFRLFNNNGSLVATKTFNHVAGINTFSVMAGELSSGLYTYSLSCEGSTYRGKLVILP